MRKRTAGPAVILALIATMAGTAHGDDIGVDDDIAIVNAVIGYGDICVDSAGTEIWTFSPDEAAEKEAAGSRGASDAPDACTPYTAMPGAISRATVSAPTHCEPPPTATTTARPGETRAGEELAAGVDFGIRVRSGGGGALPCAARPRLSARRRAAAGGRVEQQHR